MNSLDKRLGEILSEREKKGTLRSLKSYDGKIDFFSNDYLGLSKVDTYNTTRKFSGTGSRLIAGTSNRILDIEKYIAKHFKAEAALVFNSGYDANVGLLSSIPQRNDTILYDELIHASARDGIRLSLAKSFSFRHNDLNHLEDLLKKSQGQVFVVVESLYSMDGDFSPIEDLLNLTEKYGAHVILDEAHSGGILGNHGGGISEQLAIENRLFARIYTFGKGFGSHGACIVGSTTLIQYLVNFARSFIYTTALPPQAFDRIFSILSETNFTALQQRLKTNIQFFLNSITQGSSPIQNIQFNSNEELKQKEELLLNEGFAVKGIYSPTVAKGEERIRICIHSFNTEDDILRLKTLLA